MLWLYTAPLILLLPSTPTPSTFFVCMHTAKNSVVRRWNALYKSDGLSTPQRTVRFAVEIHLTKVLDYHKLQPSLTYAYPGLVGGLVTVDRQQAVHFLVQLWCHFTICGSTRLLRQWKVPLDLEDEGSLKAGTKEQGIVEGTKEREKTSGNKLTNAVLKVFAIASATLKTVVWCYFSDVFVLHCWWC